nr:SRPBCC family protein [Mycobacterium bourgelatii]
MRLPGDALVRDPAIQTTEAVYIDAPVAAVLPEVLRTCQLASGFSKSDELPDIAVGDTLHVGFPAKMGRHHTLRFTVVEMVPDSHIVLSLAEPGLAGNAVVSFHLQPHWEDRARLLIRARVALRYPGEVFVVELIRPLVSLGARGFLLSVKRRAERSTSSSVSFSA